jgi:hypothetical protein
VPDASAVSGDVVTSALNGMTYVVQNLTAALVTISLVGAYRLLPITMTRIRIAVPTEAIVDATLKGRLYSEANYLEPSKTLRPSFGRNEEFVFSGYIDTEPELLRARFHVSVRQRHVHKSRSR